MEGMLSLLFDVMIAEFEYLSISLKDIMNVIQGPIWWWVHLPRYVGCNLNTKKMAENGKNWGKIGKIDKTPQNCNDKKKNLKFKKGNSRKKLAKKGKMTEKEKKNKNQEK